MKGSTMRAVAIQALCITLALSQPLPSRLPSFQVPHHYDLAVHPMFDIDNEQFPYFGEVAIRLSLTEATESLVVHVVDLEIDEIELYRVSSPDFLLRPTSTVYNEDFQMLTINFGQTLAPADDDYVLVFEYHGELRSDLFGFYRARHDGPNGAEYIASTQFSSVHARKAFPCFDEPRLKATFKVTLVGDFPTILGNMPAEEDLTFDTARPTAFASFGANSTAFLRRRMANRKPRLGGHSPYVRRRNAAVEREVILETTPVALYTGILVWVFCDYESTETILTERGVPVRAWAPQGLSQYALHSRDAAAAALDYFEEKFEIDYPLPKLDMISIPEFFFGAMENWGLVTFSTAAFLIDPAVDPTSRRDSATRTVSHEIAHSWFGNTITAEWWDDTWLHEGFATFFAPYGVDAAFPEWKELDTFQWNTADRAFDVDGLLSTQPIKTDFETPSELLNVFTTQAYQKGASIIEMISTRMGRLEDGDAPDSPFWRALVEYFDQFAYESAEADDLFNILVKYVDDPTFDVEAMKSSWILRSGYPIVEVAHTFGGVELRQSQFIANAPQKETKQCAREPLIDTSSPSAFVHGERVMQHSTSIVASAEDLERSLVDQEPYYIPLTYRANSTTGVAYVEMAAPTAFIPWTRNDGWLKINVDSSGFYRVRYPDDMWQLIVTQLRQSDFSVDPSFPSAFSVHDRAGLLRDAFTYATLPDTHQYAGADSIIQAIDLSTYLPLSRETAYTPWSFALRGLLSLAPRLTTASRPLAYERFLTSLLPRVIDYVGFEEVNSGERPEEHARALLRMKVHDVAVLVKAAPICTDVTRRLLTHLTTNEPIHPDLVAAVWNGAASFNRFYESVFNIATQADSPDQQRAFTALGYYRDPEIIRSIFGAMVNGSLPLSIPLIERLSISNRGTSQILQLAVANWDTICRAWCDNASSIRRLFAAILGNLSYQRELDLVEAFFQDPSTAFGETGVGKCEYERQVGVVLSNIEWMATVGERVLEHISRLNDEQYRVSLS